MLSFLGCSKSIPPACLGARPAGFPTRKPFLQFAQRYALLLPGGRRRLAELGVPLTPSGFVNWYEASDEQVGSCPPVNLSARQI